jgi:hypothetical protein
MTILSRIPWTVEDFILGLFYKNKNDILLTGYDVYYNNIFVYRK